MLSMDQIYPNVACLCRGKTRKSTLFENMNRRTAEQGTAEYRSEKHCLTPFKNFCCSKFLVRYCPSDSPPCGRVPGFQAPDYRFQCSRLRLKGFGATSSVPRCRFASTRLGFFILSLTPDTRHLKPSQQLVASSQHMCRLPYSPFS